MLKLIRNRAALIVAGLVAGLAPMLMAPSGGYPSRPTFQQVTSVNTEAYTAKGTATGVSNVSYLAFRDSAGTRTGYVGDPSISDANVALSCDTSPCNVQILPTAGIVTTGGAPLLMPNCVYKQGGTSRTSNTTLTADPELSIGITINGFYHLHQWIELSAAGAGAGGFKWNYSGTSTSSGRGDNGVANGVTFSKPETSAMGTQNTIATLATATNDWITTNGVIHVANAPQTFALQWAQNTSSGDTTSVLADSYLCIDRIQ